MTRRPAPIEDDFVLVEPHDDFVMVDHVRCDNAAQVKSPIEPLSALKRTSSLPSQASAAPLISRVGLHAHAATRTPLRPSVTAPAGLSAAAAESAVD